MKAMASKPCITPGCNRIAHTGPRCTTCTRTVTAVKNHRRRTLAPPTGAAAHLRAAIRNNGGAHCEGCGQWDPRAQADHRIELADGGTDDPGNVQALCIPCHQAKSTASHTARSRGRRT